MFSLRKRFYLLPTGDRKGSARWRGGSGTNCKNPVRVREIEIFCFFVEDAKNNNYLFVIYKKVSWNVTKI